LPPRSLNRPELSALLMVPQKKEIDDEFFLVLTILIFWKILSDVPLETLAEGSQLQQKIAKDCAQDRQTGQTLSNIVTQAAEDKPHHREKTLQSLQTFTKAMMGLGSSAKPEELPTSVTTEELAVWESWRERRKTALKKRLDEETAKNPNANKQEIKLIRKSALDKLKSFLVGVTFRSAAIVASSPILMHIKREMETNLAKAGFPRFTFDWNAQLLHDSVWNTVMRGNVEVMESALPGIKICPTTKVRSICEKYKEKGKVYLTGSHSVCHNKTDHFLPSQIANLWAETLIQLLPEQKILGHLLRDPDAVLDFEEENQNTAPQRISARWRSVYMENNIRCIDVPAKQRAKGPQKKISVAGLLDCSSFRAPTFNKAAQQLVPNCFPRDASVATMGLDVMSEEMVQKSGAIANAPALNNHPPPGDSSSATGPS
ncbi:uncharacterized protein VP01_5546g1, partial [Puccinia sorghi]